jgi:hypothetical protein
MEGGNPAMMQQLIFKLKMFFSKSILPYYSMTKKKKYR